MRFATKPKNKANTYYFADIHINVKRAFSVMEMNSLNELSMELSLQEKF